MQTVIWHQSRNLPNVLRHVKSFTGTEDVTVDNAWSWLEANSTKWEYCSTYEKHQANLEMGIKAVLEKRDVKDLSRVADIHFIINSNIDFSNAWTYARIGKLVQEYKICSYEWYSHLASNGLPFNYNVDNLLKTLSEAEDTLKRKNYYIDHDRNGIAMKQSFTGFYDNHGSGGYDAVLNIKKYDDRNNPGIMYRLGEFVALEICGAKQ